MVPRHELMDAEIDAMVKRIRMPLWKVISGPMICAAIGLAIYYMVVRTWLFN